MEDRCPCASTHIGELHLRRSHGWCILLAALFLLSHASPARSQFVPVPGREYREYLNPVNPVRGEAVIGLSVAPTEAEQRSTVAQVLLPAMFDGEVRIETSTADGRFRGEGVFSGSTKSKQWVSLPLATKSGSGGPSELQRPASPLALAIAARGTKGEIYLVRWGDAATAASPERLRLYINSKRADMFVRAGSKVVRCAPVGISQPVRFDSYCDVNLIDIPPDGGLLLIRRDQFDEQTQTLKVYLP